MTENDVDRIKISYDVDRDLAVDALKITSHENSPSGTGRTFVDVYTEINELAFNFGSKFSRRHFLVILATSFGGSIYAGKKVEEALDWIDASPIPLQFDAGFISAFNRHREDRDLPAKVAEYARKDEEVSLAAYLRSFAEGSYLNSEQCIHLAAMMSRASDAPTKLLISDVMSSQFIRGGCSSEAARIFSIDEDSLSSVDERLIFAEKMLSIAYTGLDTKLALSPEYWGFAPAIRQASLAGIEEFGVEIDLDSGDVRIPSSISIPTDGPWSGIKGFYIINWLILYWTAKHQDSDRADCAAVHLKALTGYSNKDTFSRASWNMAYFAAMQFHRMKEHGLRDAFLNFCLNSDFSQRTKSVERLSKLAAPDIAALSMTFFLKADPVLKNSEFARMTVGARSIVALDAGVRPRIFKRAIGQLKANVGNYETPLESFDRCAADDLTFAAYMPPLEDVVVKYCRQLSDEVTR